MKHLPVILLLLISSPPVMGQGVIVDQPKMLFHNEQTLGIQLNSNGFGADFRYARFINARNDRIYDVSFDYVKHPKEIKSIVTTNFYPSRFVYGKKNLFWELKGQIGHQHELFRKYDFSSISIRLAYSGGLSIGFLKPIYYEINTYSSSGLDIISTEEKKFDPGIHLYNYGGTAAFTKGFDELEPIPGITANGTLSFEYSEREPVVHALEAGIGFTVYPKNIEIMATEELSFFFFNMHVGYRFGTMLDISETARAKSWKERRQERREAKEQASPVRLQY